MRVDTLTWLCRSDEQWYYIFARGDESGGKELVWIGELNDCASAPCSMFNVVIICRQRDTRQARLPIISGLTLQTIPCAEMCA